MTGMFDPNGPGSDLMNFGFATAAASQQPGVSTMSALGQGGMGMNAAALQGAQTQDIRAQTQQRQLQNQMIPLQLQFMKMRMDAAQQDADEDNSTTPATNTGGTPWVTPLGGSSTNKQPTSYPADPDNPKSISNPTYMSMVPAVFKTAQNVGVEPALLHGVYMSESGGATNVPNGDGGKAIGSMQLHAGAAKDAGGGNRNDPTENLQMGAKYLKQQIDKYGDPVTGILAYNWGPGNVDKWRAAGSDPSQIPQPQKDYVNKVLNSAIQVGYTPPSPMGATGDTTSQPQRNLGQGVAPPAQSALNLPPELQQTVKRLKRERNLTFDPAEQSKIDTEIGNIYQSAPGYKKDQKTAEKGGENIADSKKTLDTIYSSIDTQIANLETLKKLSKRMPDRGPYDAEVRWSKHFGSQDMSSAVADFNTMNKQMFVNGLMGSIPPGSRLDIPIVKSLQTAKEVDPRTDKKSREEVIDRHIETLRQARENAKKNYELTSGTSSDSSGYMLSSKENSASDSTAPIKKWQRVKGQLVLAQ